MASAALFALSTPSVATPLLSHARGRRTSMAGVSNVEKLVLDRAALADLRARDHAVIAAFPLGGKRDADLVVDRFEPFAPGARVDVMEAGGRRELALPDQVYFNGTVAGEDDSLTSLAAAATTIYERDTAVRLRFSYIRLWGAGTVDPWTATDASAALGEVRTYWNDPANDMASIAGPRTVVHFLSGKRVQGGIAYLNVLCNARYGYGVSQVFGSFDLSRPSQIWDVLVFSHELGHNFGSPHTHCYSPPNAES